MPLIYFFPTSSLLFCENEKAELNSRLKVFMERICLGTDMEKERHVKSKKHGIPDWFGWEGS